MSDLLPLILDELKRADTATRREFAALLWSEQLDEEHLLDAEQAAALLGVHPQTMVRWARAGRIAAEKVGRAWRFKADRLEVAPVRRAPATPLAPRQVLTRSTATRSSVAAIRGG